MTIRKRGLLETDSAEEKSARTGVARRWPLVALCGVTGLVMSAALFLLLSQHEYRLAEARFHLDAERQADRIHHVARDVVACVRVLHAFFAGSELVEPDEFHIFTEPLVKAAPRAMAFGWAARAPGDDGAEFFPVLYLRGKGRLPVDIGWNLASLPECRESLERARVAGSSTLSAAFPLDGVDSPVVLAAEPARNDEREGFVFSLFTPADVLHSALYPVLAKTMNVRVFDAQQPGSRVLMAEHQADGEYPARTSWRNRRTMPPFIREFEAGGRTWLVECRPTDALVAGRRSWLPWTAAAAGIVLTAAVAGILVLLAAQTAQVERLVTTRTAEARHSEQRLRTMTDAALDAVVVMAPDGTVAHWNPAAERMFGYRRSDILGRDIHATLVPDEYREKAAREMERFAETGQGAAVGKVLELDAVRSDGTRFPVEMSVAAIPAGDRWAAVAIVRDITERRAAEDAVRAEQALLRQMLDFQERERKLMAYEIHDGLVQQLTGALLTLQAPAGDDASARDRAESACGLLRDAIGEARRIISGLRPPILDESGVEPAVAYLVDQQKRRGGPRVELESDIGDERFPPMVETAVFRIVQEGLNNACRYSRSDRVRVELHAKGEQIHVDIRDWGEGFDPARVGAGHFGLQGIHERARLLGGNAAVHSAPGKGTTIRVILPTRTPANGAIDPPGGRRQ